MTKDEKKKYLETFMNDIKLGCEVMIDTGLDMNISPNGSPLATFSVVLQEYVLMLAEAQKGGKKPVAVQKPKELVSAEKQKAWEGFVQEDDSTPVKRTMH